MQDTNFGLPSIDEQRWQARRWARMLTDAGYVICFQYTGEAEPFDREWQVWTTGGEGKRIATIDIDGCGASWHGPDQLWLDVIGKREGVTD